MTARMVLLAGLLCFALLAGLTLYTPDAHAAGFASGESKVGLGELFGKKREATGVGPSRTQLAVTIGATVVMVLVVKYL